MASFIDNINLNQNEIQNVVSQNLGSNPPSPKPGQWYFNTTNGIKRLRYYTGVDGVDGAVGWLQIDPNIDNYVNGANFTTSTGNLALTRTGGLSDVIVNLDGRYLTQNQNITLTGNITGSGTSNIITTLDPTAISDKADAAVTANGDLIGTSYFLVHQAGALRKYSWANIDSYIQHVVSTSSTVSAFTNTVSVGGVVTFSITTPTGVLSADFTVQGTPNQIKRTVAGDVITFGLEDDVEIVGDLVVQGDLTVNGTMTAINTDELRVEDNIITVNSNVTGTPTLNGGLEVERGTEPNTGVIWNEATDRWTFSNDGTAYFNIPIPGEYNFYVHPNYTPRTIDGSGLQFVQDFASDSLGHVTSVILGDIPLANTTVLGVVRFANATDVTNLSNSTAVTPADVATIVANLVSSSIARATISPVNNTVTNVTHNFGTKDVDINCYDLASGEEVFPTIKRPDNNTISIGVGVNPFPDLRILIEKR